VSKAAAAIKTAPGVLAVKVDYETKQATIGTKKGAALPMAEIIAGLKSIGYVGELAQPATDQ
jgi:copper chaperone CopZ